jgi:hypothetical protein
VLSRLTLLFAITLTGCIRDDPNHCANKSGDATCVEKYNGGYCSTCTPKFDGCVEKPEDIEPGCRFGGSTTQADDDDSADPTSMSMSMSMSSDSVADDSATSTSTTETSMTSMTSVDDGSSSSGGEELPHCGNNVIDTEDENCDGDAQPHQTCEDVGLMAGKMGSDIGCYEPGSVNECKYDLSLCANTETCGNKLIEGNEQCEAGVPIEATCAELSPNFIDGQPTCSECMFNTTACTECIPNNQPCTSSAQCCGEALCLVNCIL